MKHALISLTCLAFACFLARPAFSQTVTEALQKQIWGSQDHYTLADWEVLLPSANQDTVFSADGQFAEFIQVNAAGFPTTVTTLALSGSTWLPLSRTQARFDGFGRLVSLQSWIWENDNWQNESLSTAVGERMTICFWEEDAWQTAYEGHLETQYAAAATE